MVDYSGAQFLYFLFSLESFKISLIKFNPLAPHFLNSWKMFSKKKSKGRKSEFSENVLKTFQWVWFRGSSCFVGRGREGDGITDLATIFGTGASLPSILASSASLWSEITIQVGFVPTCEHPASDFVSLTTLWIVHSRKWAHFFQSIEISSFLDLQLIISVDVNTVGLLRSGWMLDVI